MLISDRKLSISIQHSTISIFSTSLLRLFMPRVLAAEAAVLAQLEPLARLLFVLRRAVVAALTFVTRQRDDVSHQ
jgi:hypothetical protein